MPCGIEATLIDVGIILLGKILGIPGIHGHIFGRDGSTIQDSIGCIGKTIIGHSPFKAIGLPPAAGGGGKSQAHGSPDFGNAGTYFVGKIPRQGIAAPGDQGIHLIIYAVIYHAAPYGGTLGLAGSNGSVYATSYQRIRIRHRVRDTATIRKILEEKLLSKYSEEEWANLPDKEKEELLSDVLEPITKKPVWFRIEEESYGKYYIMMFYDNEYNHANGEDL